MKLLAKKEINVLKAKEQRLVQDEGLKLAKRVDSLREIASEEEQSLKQFRENTVAVINKEIVEQTQIRDSLKFEVSKLQEEKELALKPIVDEIDELEQQRRLLLQERQRVDYRLVQASRHEEYVKSLEKENTDEKQRIEQERERTTQLLKDADNVLMQKQQLVVETQAIKTEAESLRNSLQNEIAQKELGFKNREESQKKRDQEQDTREKELNSREALLRDREQTVERSINRLKK